MTNVQHAKRNKNKAIWVKINIKKCDVMVYV